MTPKRTLVKDWLNYDEIDGYISTHNNTYMVVVQTANRTTQRNQIGQKFVQRLRIQEDKPINLQIAKLFRNLANSIEKEWEKL